MQKKLQFLLLSASVFLNSNSFANEFLINRMLKKGYQLVINRNDTLTFETLYLDSAYNHNFIIHKKTKTIHLTIQNKSSNELISYETLESLYNENSKGISWVMYQGTVINKDNKVYFQRTLISNPIRIPDETLSKTSCYRKYGGDGLIIW